MIVSEPPLGGSSFIGGKGMYDVNMQCRFCKYARDNGSESTCYCVAHDGDMSLYYSCVLFSSYDRRNADADNNRLHQGSSRQTR